MPDRQAELHQLYTNAKAVVDAQSDPAAVAAGNMGLYALYSFLADVNTIATSLETIALSQHRIATAPDRMGDKPTTEPT